MRKVLRASFRVWRWLGFVLLGAIGSASGGAPPESVPAAAPRDVVEADALMLKEFAFHSLTVRVRDSSGDPVAGTEVAAYCRKWPLAYPKHGFARTSVEGEATLLVPGGTWDIIAGGGDGLRKRGSGRALLLGRTVRVADDRTVELVPDTGVRMAFVGVDGEPLALDTLHGKPGQMPAYTRLPTIGSSSAKGQWRLETLREMPLTLVMVRNPEPTQPGYVFLKQRVPARDRTAIRAASRACTRLEFSGFSPSGDPTPIEWSLAFPHVDLSRRWGFTGFNTAEGTVYTNMPFMNYRATLKVQGQGDGVPSCYEFCHRGAVLQAGKRLHIRAGGPITKRQFQILLEPAGFQHRCQFLLGPVTDAYGNEVKFYFQRGRGIPRASHPFEVRSSTGAGLLHSGTFDVSADSLGFQLDKHFPKTAVFRLDWDMGPYGKQEVFEGVISDSQFRYGLDTVETANFTVHGPEGYRSRLEALGERLERVRPAMLDILGADPANTRERNLFIHPVGIWASGRGQEIFRHGFVQWHTRDPASLGWQRVVFHEVGHRFVAESFAKAGSPSRLTGFRNEVTASLLGQTAISSVHGAQFSWLWRNDEGQRFFGNLANPQAPPHEPKHNIFFVVQSYLPTRFGPDINRRFYRLWLPASSELKPSGYTEEEIYAALYSQLAKTNLGWLFRHCGFSVTDERIRDGKRRLNSMGQ